MKSLADMKMTKSEKKDTMPTTAEANSPSYPYGLRLSLDSAALEKLGITSLPKVGAKLMVHGMGVVTSVSQHESKNNDSRNVEIQLQEMGVESAEPATEKERNELRREEFNAALDSEKKRRA
jgi:chromosome condensin MukBEF ATPase and DNA-binding subunit MukB